VGRVDAVRGNGVPYITPSALGLFPSYFLPEICPKERFAHNEYVQRLPPLRTRDRGPFYVYVSAPSASPVTLPRSPALIPVPVQPKLAGNQSLSRPAPPRIA
jgi:hypothetical protein